MQLKEYMDIWKSVESLLTQDLQNPQWNMLNFEKRSLTMQSY